MNTNQLREVAAAATPGPWRSTHTSFEKYGGAIESDGRWPYNVIAHTLESEHSNAAHIATFNPALVMKLLDVVEAAKAIDKYLPIDKIQTLLAIGDLHAAIKALEE